MKQEIVVKVQMRCDKCRTKAMELVASADGVNSVSLGGDERNQLVVVGDGVDAVSLASILRKKVGPTDIIKVGEPNSKNNGKKEREKEKEKEKDNGKNHGNKGDGDEKKEKSKDSGKQKEGKNVEQKQQHHQYHYQYDYQQQEPKMEYVQVQQQWYPGYPIYQQPQVVLYEYDTPSYAESSCSIM